MLITGVKTCYKHKSYLLFPGSRKQQYHKSTHLKNWKKGNQLISEFDIDPNIFSDIRSTHY